LEQEAKFQGVERNRYKHRYTILCKWKGNKLDDNTLLTLSVTHTEPP
jgi:hypothetical protein